jgi:hypothetical protein
MAIQQGQYGNYTGNARCCGSSGPLKEKDSTIHKRYMMNAVDDFEHGEMKAGEYEASRASAFKNIGMHLKGATAAAAPKAYGEPMHASVSSAVKNVLGPDNPHTHGKGGKVVMDNAMKLKTNQSGGGMLASDPAAAGRELLYNQSKASGLKKTGEEEFKARRAKDNEVGGANDENSARKLSLASGVKKTGKPSAVKAKKCHHNLK